MNATPQLYLVIDQSQAATDDRFTLLNASARERGLEVVQLNPDRIDWSALPELGRGSMLYRITIGRRAGVLERLVLRDHVATLLIDNEYSLRPMGDLATTILEDRAGVPVIPTIYDLTADRELLLRYAAHLGGFPIVVKRMVGSRGVGVMRVDSMEALVSLADVLLDSGDAFVLRRYIANASHLRLIVLGERVISCVRYQKVADDFRTNATATPTVVPAQPSQAMCDIAVAAVRSHGFEFGGVDLLLAQGGNMFVAEANFPCYFPRNQRATGDDVSGMMIDHLLRKRRVLLGAGAAERRDADNA